MVGASPVKLKRKTGVDLKEKQARYGKEKGQEKNKKLNFIKASIIERKP
jgi:hypothetical protein